MSNNGVKTRWQKGQSGNPKGRSKEAGETIIGRGDSVAFIGRVVTDGAITAMRGDQVVHSTRLLRWTHTLVERADAGDVGAIRTILGYAAQWDRAREKAQQKAGKKGRRQGELTSAQKLKFRAFAELQFESSPTPAPPPTNAAPKPVVRPLVDPYPIPDYATWLKLHPDEPRCPAEPPTDTGENRQKIRRNNRRRTGGIPPVRDAKRRGKAGENDARNDATPNSPWPGVTRPPSGRVFYAANDSGTRT